MPPRISNPILLLAIAVGIVVGTGSMRTEGADEAPLFAVKFTPAGAEFSGRVDSEDTAQRLAEAVKAVRPDLSILNRGIEIDPDVVLPGFADLKAVIAELGISTAEGGIAVWDDAVLVSGMTDSQITITALKIRLDPLLEGRDFINRICIVSSADMPDLSIKLSSGETVGPLLDLEKYPDAAEVFVPPGIPLAKLHSTVIMLADPSALDDSSPPPSESGPIRAVPLMTSLPAPERSEGENQTSLPLLRATPANTYVTLESVLFGRNSFLLQANQQSRVAETIELLNKPPLAGHRILVRPVKARSATGAYGDYLIERRTEQTRQMLVEGGIAPGRLIVRSDEPATDADTGEVRLVVEIPPPAPPVEEESAEAASATTAPKDAPDDPNQTGSSPAPDPVE